MGNDNTINLRVEILSYLKSNPNAMDSLEGVVEYWLSKKDGKVSAAEVKQVLEQLVTEKIVKKVPLLDGKVLYRQG